MRIRMWLPAFPSLHGYPSQSVEYPAQYEWVKLGRRCASAAGYGPLHWARYRRTVRLPAAITHICLEPSLGRIPIYPPYWVGLPAHDPLFLMRRPYEALQNPMRAIYGSALRIARLGGCARRQGARNEELGLLIEIGLVSRRNRRCVADRDGGRAFEDAAPLSNRIGGLVTADMLDGLDLFSQSRLLAEIERLPLDRQAKVMPFLLEWCRRAKDRSAL